MGILVVKDFFMPQETNSQASGPISPAMSRRQLLMGAAICAGGLLLSRTPAQADIIDTLNKFFDLDPTVLNYAAEMEELEKDFFTRAIGSKGYTELTGREQSVFNLIAAQDTAHFKALTIERNRRGTTLRNSAEGRTQAGSQGPRAFHFPANAFSSREELLKEAISLKENVLYAYHGAVHTVGDPKLLGPAAAIAGVEGRHLVVLREIAGLDPVPTSFEGQVSPQTIGRVLGSRYGFKGGNDRRNSGGF
ncbi:ferritin-like domain-containing protein [bacterium]|nr:MAG: ferritin-like domain-containing protein [bacterium]